MYQLIEDLRKDRAEASPPDEKWQLASSLKPRPYRLGFVYSFDMTVSLRIKLYPTFISAENALLYGAVH